MNAPTNHYHQVSETLPVMRSLLSSALDSDDSWMLCPAWSTSSTLYYDRLARHIETCDPETLQIFHALLTKIRGTYRSYAEHDRQVQRVPLVKQTDASVKESLHDDCCVCLTPLQSHQKTVRLRAASGNADICGHFLHARCLLRLQPTSSTGKVSCPMCRVDLGRPPLRTWIDTENAIPEY